MKKSSNNPSLKDKTLSEKIILWLSFGFGTGFLRPAPGTWGTLPGIVMAYFLMPYPMLHIGVTLVLVVLGTWLCQVSSNILKVHDHSGIVIDEVVGILITLFFFTPTWQVLLLGFVVFRFFDILKPFPIRWIDKRVGGGWGIMLDDIIAAVFSWIVLKIVLTLISL